MKSKVEQSCLSVAEIFELWLQRRESAHTQRAYRGDVMAFVAFMGSIRVPSGWVWTSCARTGSACWSTSFAAAARRLPSRGLAKVC